MELALLASLMESQISCSLVPAGYVGGGKLNKGTKAPARISILAKAAPLSPFPEARQLSSSLYIPGAFQVAAPGAHSESFGQ